MIHSRQDSSSIIGGQFAGGKLYLVRANGETVVVEPGQTINDVNNDLMVLKKHQTTSEVVSGSISLVASYDMDGTYTINVDNDLYGTCS